MTRCEGGCVPSTTPNAKGACVRCGRSLRIEEPWELTLARLHRFYARVREAVEQTGGHDFAIAYGAHSRYASGLAFGDTYLLRDNAAEGLEEAEDGLNYSAMEDARLHLEDIAEADDTELRAELLLAALKFSEAHTALRRYQARLRAARG